MNTMWTPYSKRAKRQPDFVVKYCFISEDKGGRKTTPCQGYRCDFLYEGDNPTIDGVWAIWPEFLDDEMNIISDTKIHVKNTGFAFMWNINKSANEVVHSRRIFCGQKGYMVEGIRRVAEIEIVNIIELKTIVLPTKQTGV